MWSGPEMMAVVMAGWMGVLGSVRGVAEAGVIASSTSGAGSRVEDMAKVQSFLENKVVVQKLVDYGVSPAEAMAKVQAMSAQDLHRLASLTDRAAAGTAKTRFAATLSPSQSEARLRVGSGPASSWTAASMNVKAIP